MAKRALGISLLLPLLLAGCDNFSLPGQFQFALNLALDKTVVHPGEQSTLSPTGGTAPYTATASAVSLYNDGVHQDDPGSIQNMVYTAGNSIGTVQITLSDSAGHSANATISVLPWAPQSFTAAGKIAPPWKTVNLTWTYTSQGYISGFKLLGSQTAASGPFTQVTLTNAATYAYTDTGAVQQTNYYQLYAVAGSYVSDSCATANATGK